jgi:hypothetical protein
MKSLNTKLFLFISFLFIAIGTTGFLSGCGSPNSTGSTGTIDTNLIGKWEYKTGSYVGSLNVSITMILALADDGTFTYDYVCISNDYSSPSLNYAEAWHYKGKYIMPSKNDVVFSDLEIYSFQKKAAYVSSTEITYDEYTKIETSTKEIEYQYELDEKGSLVVGDGTSKSKNGSESLMMIDANSGFVRK